MNEPSPRDLSLPGLQVPAAAAPEPKAPSGAVVRLRPIDRSQLVWRTVDVEALIEEDHPARGIWAFVGQLDLAAFYAPIQAVQGGAGRPPWDPRLLVSLWLYAYSRGMGSAREIGRRCTFDPAFQWLCGMEEVNHHTLSDFRVAFGPALDELFAQALGVLSAAGLVNLERVMHDGCKIKACAAGESFSRQERLAAHLEAARQQLAALQASAPEESTRQQAARQRAVRQREQRVTEALAELDTLRQTKTKAQEKAAVRVSVSEPQARIMKHPDGSYAPSYNAQLSTEASHKIIVGVGVSQCGTDYGELRGAVQRVQQNLGRRPGQMVADGGFISRQNIIELDAQGVELIGPEGGRERPSDERLRRRGLSPEFFPRAFVYDAGQDTYRCPAGQTLRHVSQKQVLGAVRHQYRAEPGLCQACRFRSQCCPKAGRPGRSITRTVQSGLVQQFIQKMGIPEVKQIYRQRSPVAEFPNAWIKEKLGLRRFHLRGLAKVAMELVWVCLTYNVQQWIRLRWRPGLATSTG